MSAILWIAFPFAVALAPVAPRLAALILASAALYALRLQPRKRLDISWSHLIAAIYFAAFGGSKSRQSLESEISHIWSPMRGDGMVFLSARTGMDLLFSALNLPKGSEVLFWPGLNIPAVTEIVESHGLHCRCAETAPEQMHLTLEDLDRQLTPETKVLMVTHLFGAVHDVGPIIKAAKARGLFVIEDCAQAFVGAGMGVGGGQLRNGFRGHAESDAAFFSFGIIKTLSALGGSTGHVRDETLRRKMQELNAAYSVRSTSQFVWVVAKVAIYKVLSTPCLWGFTSALCASIGMDFDGKVTRCSRGFPDKDAFRQRPSSALLQLLHRRLRSEHEAGLESSISPSALASRTKMGEYVAARLREAGVEVLSCPVGEVQVSTWWLLAVLDDEPHMFVAELHKLGFDATCTSSQLQSVARCSRNSSSGGANSPTAAAMKRTIYLPDTTYMSQAVAEGLVAAVVSVKKKLATRHAAESAHAARSDSTSRPERQRSLQLRKTGSRRATIVLLAAVCLFFKPGMILSFLPTMRMTMWFGIACASLVMISIVILRRLAATPELRVSSDFLNALDTRIKRPQGLDYCRSQENPFNQHLNGAVLLSGATGFVGGATLFMLLARAKELGISRIAVLIRSKGGVSVQRRLQDLRATKAFSEVQELFDELVVPIEGDIAMPGWIDQQRRQWPYDQPLRAVIHCAADVRFDQRLQQAAISSITASLQAVQIAVHWGAERFVYVSTAFVHAVPSVGPGLGEHLVELRDFDPNELYKDIVADGSWAEKAMHELGFPNTYTFTKALAEHLVVRACSAAKLDARIVRPSIITPAWAAPHAGWCGDAPKASPIVAGSFLLLRRAVRVFAGSDDAIPMMPVDFVAETIVRALLAPRSSVQALIMNAAVDRSEALRVPSFQNLIMNLIRLLAITGEMSLQEAGLLARLLIACKSSSKFWFLDTLVNVAPATVLLILCTACEWIASWLPGYDPATWKRRCAGASALSKYCSVPAQYLPFSCPRSAWLFNSSFRLPSDWNSMEYSLLIYRAAASFAPAYRSRSGSAAPFSEVHVAPKRSAWLDLLLTLGTPGASFFVCVSAFLVRRVLVWMDLTVTVDALSLKAVTNLGMPLILCPTHRSLLDFVVIGISCLQLQPILPTLQMPHVAADAEFSRLPFLGHVLKALGAFFVRRGGSSVQPDPALRAEVARVYRKGRPIEVFLEGARSRGRRHLKLRKGFLNVLRDISQRSVALVPMALSYELLPEDSSFHDELQGIPRPPLRTTTLVQWVFQGMRGELPSYGAAHVRLGSAHVLDAESRLPELLTQVQEQHIGLTSMTTLHARALAEVLDSTQEEVLEAFTGVGLTARPSSVSDRVQLNDASRWALALQAAAALRKSIPARWASWLVEPSVSTQSVLSTPVDEGDELGEATRGNSELDSDLDAMEEAEEKIRMMPAPEDVNKVIVKLCRCLSAVEEAAKAEAAVLRAAGVQQLTEEHLFRQLLKRQQSGVSLPPALARGAAHIVAAAWPTNLGEPGSENTISSSLSSPEKDVVPLWPTMQATRDSNEPALERWGYKDTKFVGHWVDGVQAIKMTSTRYGKIGGRPLYRLWSFFQSEFSITMNVRNTLPERPLPQLPEPAEGLLKQLGDALPEDRIHTSLHSRLRAGTGHGLADIWRLRAGEVLRMPDAVVRPQTEQEVLQLLQKASAKGFAVIPVGGRTNVTSATVCPPREVDDRPFVAIDMTGLSSIKWVKKEDGVALVEAGITGTALKEALQSKGVNMGMEPDSMEFSTLGGWIATRASGMKRSRYGNIEDMVIEVRVVTPAGILWQHNGQMPDSAGVPATAFGRVSANVALPGLLLGSEGCLGVVVAAVVRVKPLPEVVEYESVIFPSWDNGARWMHEVAKLPAALRPASCRLMDNKQLSLARAVNEDPTKGQLRGLMQEAFLHLRGVSMKNAAAATIVFEGSKDEVSMQKRALRRLLRGSRGLWGGAASGEAGYAMTYAIAYIRDFGLDHQILSESLETMVPWSAIGKVWPAVVTALEAKHSQLRLPGRPFLSCRMTQLYDEGGVLYMYIATCTAGLSAEKALEAFLSLEHTARRVILQEGGCLSHHHGIGKHRCSHLEETQASITSTALRGLKVAMDPKNVLAARNGVWADVIVDM